MPPARSCQAARAHARPANARWWAAILIGWCVLWSPSAQAIGGNGGTAFAIQCTGSEQVMAVILREGQRIDSVGIVCRNTAGAQRQLIVGGTGGRPQSFNAGTAGRHINKVQIAIGKCGRNTTRVCGLMLVGDLGFGQRFGTLTHDNRQFNADPNHELVGFRGRAGQEIDNLEPIWRNRQRPAYSQTQRIDANQIADAISVLFDSLELHVNNIGERRGNSWHDPDSGYLRLAGVPRSLNIPEFTYRRDNWRRRYFYYVNDVNARPGSARVWFKEAWQAYILRIDFEDDGNEIKGKCRLKKANGDYKACPGPNEGDGNAPDVQWSNPALEITLVPQVVNRGPNQRNGVALRADNVVVRGDFNMHGLCGTLPNHCQTLLQGWKGKLIVGIENSLMAGINGAATQTAMADATRPLLNAASIPNLTDAIVIGDELELRW